MQIDAAPEVSGKCDILPNSLCVVLANSDHLDKLGVVAHRSIPVWAPIHGARCFRLLLVSEPRCAPVGDSSPAPSNRRPSALREAPKTDASRSILVGCAESACREHSRRSIDTKTTEAPTQSTGTRADSGSYQTTMGGEEESGCRRRSRQNGGVSFYFARAGVLFQAVTPVLCRKLPGATKN
jgi:hypothetical protein